MRILVVYGSTEGHTADLAAFVAKVLRDDGQEVIVRDSAAKELAADPSRYDVVFLAGSLHVGRYQAALKEFARTHHETLNAMPSAFISVSLSAAGENPDDWDGLQECVGRFAQETMWTPKAIHHAAGAIRNSQYDFFKRLAIKYIARQRGKQTVTSQDYDLTDYSALKNFVFTFVNHEIGKHGRRSGALPPTL